VDGTRLGDRYLNLLPAPPFRWALPIRQAGSELESVPAQPLEHPQFIAILDVDASGGFDVPAKVKLDHVFRQDEAFAVRTRLAALSPDEVDRILRSYWQKQEEWIDPDRMSWRYDEKEGATILTLVGKAKPEWRGNDREGRKLDIWDAGFYSPNKLHRPPEQDQTAPWLTDYPKFKCWATTIHLPPSGAQWHWSYYADPMNLQLGGTRYWRAAALQGNVMRTVMSRNVYLPEISATEAKNLNDAISGFNNNQSNVFEKTAKAGTKEPVSVSDLPFHDNEDWVGSASACSGPSKK
jgi:hypothetical protein